MHFDNNELRILIRHILNERIGDGGSTMAISPPRWTSMFDDIFGRDAVRAWGGIIPRSFTQGYGGPLGVLLVIMASGGWTKLSELLGEDLTESAFVIGFTKFFSEIVEKIDPELSADHYFPSVYELLTTQAVGEEGEKILEQGNVPMFSDALQYDLDNLAIRINDLKVGTLLEQMNKLIAFLGSNMPVDEIVRILEDTDPSSFEQSLIQRMYNDHVLRLMIEKAMNDWENSTLELVKDFPDTSNDVLNMFINARAKVGIIE